MTLGEKLQRLRLQNGMSQDTLAQRLDVSRQAVSKWERDEAVPDLDKILKLSELYGVSLDSLLKDQPEMTHTAKTQEAKTQEAKTGESPKQRTHWNQALTWVGLLGGIAMVIWGLMDAAGILLFQSIANGMLSGVAGVMESASIAEGSGILSEFMRVPSLLLVQPLLKILCGVLLILLGLWAHKKGKK